MERCKYNLVATKERCRIDKTSQCSTDIILLLDFLIDSYHVCVEHHSNTLRGRPLGRAHNIAKVPLIAWIETHWSITEIEFGLVPLAVV